MHQTKRIIKIIAIALLINLVFTFKVDPHTKLIQDNQGQFRIFHGVNVAYKVHPYLPPIIDSFHYQNSFSDEDGARLKSWGMNIVRLTFYWEAVEPTGPGQYNMQYINNLKRIIEICDKYDIQVVLDLHQDAASKFYCGEGMPDWAVERREDFPAPYKLDMSYDKDGYPDMKSCLSTGFINFYKSDAIQIAFQDLYDNARGIRDHFANMWKKIASETKKYENVLGYEIINEPYAGHVNKDQSLLWTGGNRNLLRLYKAVHEKIREVDDEKIIFFEGTWTDNTYGSLTKSPGGDTYNDRQMFSYHLYCSELGDPQNIFDCNYKIQSQDLIYKKQMWKMNVGGFLSEFGAISGAEGPGIETNRNILDLADSRFHSWAYWQYKYYDDYTTLARPSESEGFFDSTGKVLHNKIKLLSRPYATSICGLPLLMKFANNRLVIKLKYDRNCGESNKVQFYINHQYYFPEGIKLLSNCTSCQIKKVSDHYYEIDHSKEEFGQEIVHNIVSA